MSSNIFYISDLHFGHNNVIKFDNRPFKTTEEMNETLINNWNSRVKPGDTVYVLGDFSMYLTPVEAIDILRRLNGNIHLIKGNHDKTLGSAKGKFASVHDILTVKDTIGPDNTPCSVVLSHYFMPCYLHNQYAYHLYGHSHSTAEFVIEEEIKAHLRANGKRCEAYNVGCMHLGYTPRTLDEIVYLWNPA